MHPPEPVLEVAYLYMQHLEVLALVGEGLFQVGIVLFKGDVSGPTVRKCLGVVLDVVFEQRPKGFCAVIRDNPGIAPAGLAVPVLEGDYHAHLALALAPALFPGLRGAYLELVHVDLVLQRVLFAALHGRLHQPVQIRGMDFIEAQGPDGLIVGEQENDIGLSFPFFLSVRLLLLAGHRQ